MELPAQPVLPPDQGHAGQGRGQGQDQRRESRPGGVESPDPALPARREVRRKEEEAHRRQGVEHCQAVAQELGEAPEEAEEVALGGDALPGPGELIHDGLGLQLLVVHGQAFLRHGGHGQLVGGEGLRPAGPAEHPASAPQDEVQGHPPPHQLHHALPARQEAVQDAGAEEDVHKGEGALQQGGDEGGGDGRGPPAVYEG